MVGPVAVPGQVLGTGRAGRRGSIVVACTAACRATPGCSGIGSVKLEDVAGSPYWAIRETRVASSSSFLATALLWAGWAPAAAGTNAPLFAFQQAEASRAYVDGPVCGYMLTVPPASTTAEPRLPCGSHCSRTASIEENGPPTASSWKPADVGVHRLTRRSESRC